MWGRVRVRAPLPLAFLFLSTFPLPPIQTISTTNKNKEIALCATKKNGDVCVREAKTSGCGWRRQLFDNGRPFFSCAFSCARPFSRSLSRAVPASNAFCTWWRAPAAGGCGCGPRGWGVWAGAVSLEGGGGRWGDALTPRAHLPPPALQPLATLRPQCAFLWGQGSSVLVAQGPRGLPSAQAAGGGARRPLRTPLTHAFPLIPTSSTARLRVRQPGRRSSHRHDARPALGGARCTRRRGRPPAPLQPGARPRLAPPKQAQGKGARCGSGEREGGGREEERTRIEGRAPPTTLVTFTPRSSTHLPTHLHFTGRLLRLRHARPKVALRLRRAPRF